MKKLSYSAVHIVYHTYLYHLSEREKGRQVFQEIDNVIDILNLIVSMK